MLQREIDRLDPIVVLAVHTGVAETPHSVVRPHIELLLQGLHKGFDHVKHLGVTTFQDVQHIVVSQGGEHDRALALSHARSVDFAHNLMRLVHCVNKRTPDMAGLDGELRQDGITHRFGRDTCAIRHEKDAAIRHKKWDLRKVCTQTPICRSVEVNCGDPRS